MEECFKLRNVLEEFQSKKYGKRKPTILGLREYIFTGRLDDPSNYFFSYDILCSKSLLLIKFLSFSPLPPYCSVSSLAWFMSNQETSFVTIGQRVLANLLKYVESFHANTLYTDLFLWMYIWSARIFDILMLCRVRFHYGHADIFDRIFHISIGGISKGSKTINISEDIFSGTFSYKWLGYLLIQMTCSYPFSNQDLRIWIS